MGLILLIVLALLPAALGYFGFAEDKEESLLFLKLFGYSILGLVLFWLGGFPLPLGIVIALIMAGNAPVNKGARRASAIVAFVMMLFGKLL